MARTKVVYPAFGNYSVEQHKMLCIFNALADTVCNLLPMIRGGGAPTELGSYLRAVGTEVVGFQWACSATHKSAS
jgi:hypothetical protein